MTENYTKSENVKRWFLYCIAPTFFPVIVAVTYDFIILDFDFVKAISRHSLDFILVNFAVAVSTFEIATNLETAIDNKKREMYIYKSVVLGALCLLFYAGYYLVSVDTCRAKCSAVIGFALLVFFNIKIGKDIKSCTGDLM